VSALFRQDHDIRRLAGNGMNHPFWKIAHVGRHRQNQDGDGIYGQDVTAQCDSE
jgi:hypothetical protein